MIRKRSFSIMLLASLILTIASASRADTIGISLLNPSQTASPGDTIDFDATIMNLSSTDTIFLNGDSSATTSLFLSVDDAPFLANFPLFLNPGESSGPFTLFTVLLDPAIAPGTYDLNAFTLLGGPDDASSDILGRTTFSVTVTNTVVTPEPTTLCLFVVALLSFAVVTRRR